MPKKGLQSRLFICIIPNITMFPSTQQHNKKGKSERSSALYGRGCPFWSDALNQRKMEISLPTGHIQLVALCPPVPPSPVHRPQHWKKLRGIAVSKLRSTRWQRCILPLGTYSILGSSWHPYLPKGIALPLLIAGFKQSPPPKEMETRHLRQNAL